MIQDRVDSLQQVIDQPRVTLISEQEARCRERLEELHEPGGSLNTDVTEMRGDIGNTDGQSWEEGIQAGCSRDRVRRLTARQYLIPR